MMAQKEVTKERAQWLKSRVRATHLTGADVCDADDGSNVAEKRPGDGEAIRRRRSGKHNGDGEARQVTARRGGPAV